MSERWQNLPFLGRTRDSVPVPNRGGTGTHRQRQSVTGTNQSGIGTINQKRAGTGTDASNSLNCCTFALLGPKFRTPII